MAAFLAGQSAELAFAPWKGAVDAQDVEAYRASLKERGVVTARSMFLEFQLLYVKGDECVYRVQVALWVTPDFVRLLDLKAGKEEGSALDDAVPLDTTHEVLKPLAAAGQAFDTALRGEGWKTLPFAEVEDLKALLGDALPVEEVKKDMERSAKALAAVPAELQALAPDRAFLSVDEQGFIAFGSDGKPVGAVTGNFGISDDGSVTFTLADFQGFPKPD
jgi:hypothetical protein